MTKRLLNRRALREQFDAAPPPATVEVAAPAAKAPKKAARAKAPPKPRAPRKRAVKVPPRMFARWAVCDLALKQVAVFDYRDRAAADEKLAEMLGRKPGGYVLQIVKEAVAVAAPAPPEAAPADTAATPAAP
jgi:hypothetical protein